MVVWSSNSDQLFAGSHGGDICLLRDLESIFAAPASLVASSLPLREGLGKGSSICDMKLTPDESRLLLCSHDCTLSRRHLDTQQEEVIDNTGDYDRWYTSVGISIALNCILAADNRGNVKMFDSRLPGCLNQYSLHRSHKIGCIDIESRGHVFATSSNDRTCRVFDLRRLDSGHSQNYRSELAIYPHDGVVSSGYFSPLVPYRLLTTSQNDEVRVFDVSVAGELLPPKFVIPHSHKFYQHITIIKASWHPLMKDVIAIGRYDRPRGLDMISLSSNGSKDVSVQNTTSKKVETILCVNSFSPNGRYLASATANNVVLWTSHRYSHSFNHDLTSKGDQLKERVSSAIAAQASCLESFSRSDASSAATQSLRRSNDESRAPLELDFTAFEFKRPRSK